MSEIRVEAHISAIKSEAWNALTSGDPFESYEFYAALENSQSIGAHAGWLPLYLCDYEGERLKGVCPLYVKSHSYGEYIFDHVIADAYERAGGQYYPKLLAAAPFTPVNGERIFSHSSHSRAALLKAAMQFAEDNGFSSFHLNFYNQNSAGFLEEGLAERHSVQYHFFNRNYKDFDEYLMSLTSSKRKNLRKERKSAQSSGYEIVMKKGEALTEQDWECFWQCYQDTGARKWGEPYLTQAFFQEIAETMKSKIAMALAYDGKTPVAAALNFYDARRILGRYWGSLVDEKFLHFELCYYQAIDFAIAHNIPLVEAGAQGEHKIQRGYQPVIIKSFHKFFNPSLQKAALEYFAYEAQDLDYYCQEIAKQLPYKS